jgi:Uma2 family endonuclease
MVSTRAIAEQRVVFRNISWQTFKAMLTEIGSDRVSRLTYDQGMLEIMTPLMPHERANRQIDRLIWILVEELGLNILSVGSMTCKREDLERGAEPDSSYYIQNEPLIREREEIDLTQDPPPDLVLEVEYSRSAINKLRLYASMRVPEFWRYDGRSLRIYRLDKEQYQLCENSPTFAPVAVSEIPRFLEETKKIGEVAMVRSFRAWVRQQLDTYSGK